MNDMTKVSNKAKLLYYMLFVNADDRGFVGNAEAIIKILNENDEKHKESKDKDYNNALTELKRKGLILEFTNKYECDVYLIIHWYFHNKIKKGVWTNYYKYFCLVEIVDNKYVLKEKPLKEKVNENKLNEMKLNEIKDNVMTLQQFLNKYKVNSYDELTEEQKQEWIAYADSIGGELPF